MITRMVYIGFALMLIHAIMHIGNAIDQKKKGVDVGTTIGMLIGFIMVLMYA